MTVRELIEQLQRDANPEAQVLVDGYEGGYDDIAAVNGITVVVDPSPYMGRYQEADEWNTRDGAQRLFVVVLSRS